MRTGRRRAPRRRKRRIRVGAIGAIGAIGENTLVKMVKNILTLTGLTSVKRVKAVFWWCHAHSGDARTAREKLATIPTDADIDFLFSVYSASPSRDDGGPEWGDRAVWENLHHGDPYPFWLD